MIRCCNINRIVKIVRENAFDEKKRRPRLKLNPRLVLIGLSNNWALIMSRALPWVKTTQDLVLNLDSNMNIFEKQMKFNSFCLQFDDWML